MRLSDGHSEHTGQKLANRSMLTHLKGAVGAAEELNKPRDDTAADDLVDWGALLLGQKLAELCCAVELRV